MKKIALAALLSVCVAGPALAAEPVYVGAKLGRASTNAAGLTSNRDNAYGIFAGVQFNKNFAFEAAYTNLGKVRNPAAEAKLSEWDLAVVGNLPVNAMFSLNARLGIARTKTDFNLGGTGKRTGATYGVGAQFDVNPVFAIRAGWDRYGMKDPLGVKADTDVWSVGGMFKF